MEKIVYIILLNYNGYKDTIECIDSLLNLNQVNYRIIVVDNSQGNSDLDKLIGYAQENELNYISFQQEAYSNYNSQKIIFIKSSCNKGFSHGNNIGIQFALQQKHACYFWILNNDTVVDPNSLFHLVNQLNKSQKVLLGSKLLYYHKPNIIQGVGGVFNKNFYITKHLGEGDTKNTPKEQYPKIDYAIGASMFVDKEFIDCVGLLNEDYFLYYEELDWVFRAYRKGYQVDWCEDSVVYHKEGATIGSSYRNEKSEFSELEIFKSRKKFVSEHFGLNTKFYLTTILLILNRIRKGKFKLAKQLIKNTFNDIK